MSDLEGLELCQSQYAGSKALWHFVSSILDPFLHLHIFIRVKPLQKTWLVSESRLLLGYEALALQMFPMNMTYPWFYDSPQRPQLRWPLQEFTGGAPVPIQHFIAARG